jgi:hypothetical protein
MPYSSLGIESLSFQDALHSLEYESANNMTMLDTFYTFFFQAQMAPTPPSYMSPKLKGKTWSPAIVRKIMINECKAVVRYKENWQWIYVKAVPLVSSLNGCVWTNVGMPIRCVYQKSIRSEVITSHALKYRGSWTSYMDRVIPLRKEMSVILRHERNKNRIGLYLFGMLYLVILFEA